MNKNLKQFEIFMTLQEINNFNPCPEGWKKLLKHLGKIKPDDDPINLKEILKSNGLLDVIWCFRVKKECKEIFEIYKDECKLANASADAYASANANTYVSADVYVSADAYVHAYVHAYVYDYVCEYADPNACVYARDYAIKLQTDILNKLLK